ncbi:flagellar hook-associated protein FlgK [Bacillus sp. V3B]|uniref:flagellar hook-associated protein FlgK n=1 Tax=Bacillus sp. V3B TaxID=2804915 RepID=UPI00210C7766|nr:flagellar hook-associated protein FlgK [Bacillus sp. V3B]MCQ6277134.1 flagellar hook-associated protein FlgK [Bacillus sp. V3B]
MTSTFHGLETARRALSTQQAALLTLGHNIANANTPGYTRQRVNIKPTEAFPSASLNRPQIPGQIGTGVQVGDVQRIRDSFVDMQYRTETSKLGYWEARAEQLSQMESIMNEPSETGLAHTIDQFWNSLQDLAAQPQNNGARRVVKQRGIALADTFSYIYSSLQSVQKNYRNEMNVSEQNINSILRQVNQVNKQIGSLEPHGYMPNDLYDERDRLIDELSTMVSVKIEAKPSGGLSSQNAEGLYNIYLATPQGEVLKDANNNAIKLIDSETGSANGFHIQYEDRLDLDSPVAEIKFFQLKNNETGFEGLTQIEADDSGSPIYQLNDLSQFNTNGRLRGYIEGYGYKSTVDGVETDAGLYNEMLADLDVMAYTFASKFNEVHQSGWSPIEIRTGTRDPQDFFSFNGLGLTAENPKGAAANIQLSDRILSDVDHIAAAEGPEDVDSDDTAFIGNGSNAQTLAEVKDMVLPYGGNLTNVQTFYQGMIGTLGDNASEANRMSEVAGVLKESVEQNRLSISSVSLDEEMNDMIKFQHGYNAAARNITLIDEMLDTIINRMGLVGR